MPIKRYIATADNTITNAFKENLVTRATASNMGNSDVLEVFSIYGQGSSNSVEKSRILLDFPVSIIESDRASGDIPTSGSVRFFLKLFNTPTTTTVPKKFDMQVLPLSRSWSEGTGLDMETYSDEGQSNWNASRRTTDSLVSATATAGIDIAGTQASAADVSFTINVPSSAGGSGTDITVFIDVSSDGTVGANANEIRIGADSQTDAQITDLVILGINGTDGNARVTLGAGLTSGTGIQGLTAADGSDDTKINLTVTKTGYEGNKTELKNVSGVAVVKTDKLSGGLGREETWTTPGGDFHEVGYTPGKNLPHYKQYFENGTEDLEVNITELVEEWINVSSLTDPDRTNYGILLKLSGSYEDGTRKSSYYTKKFFSRSSEFFYKRPQIEARWRDFKGDDRNNFYLSSSMMTGEDNLNTLFLYNYTRKGLTNIPALSTSPDGSDQTVGTSLIRVRLYDSGSTTKSPITFPVGGGVRDGRAKATITVAGNPGNAETFVITDSTNASVTFTFQQGNNSVAANSATTSTVGIFSVLGNNSGIASRIQQSIANSSLAVTATDNSDGTVTITQNAVGADGNKSLDMTSVTNVSVPDNTFKGGYEQDFAVGYLHETGIYSASFAYTGSAKSLYDVWSTTGDRELLTGSTITVNTHNPSYHNVDTGLVTTVTNLKSSYENSEKVRMRVFARERNKTPNVYSVSTNSSQVKVIENAFYRIFRVIDGLDVVSYGTGSNGIQTQYSRLSYDKEGNYFDLDMSLFEPGYQYAIELLYDIDGRHKVQDSIFKFRVD